MMRYCDNFLKLPLRKYLKNTTPFEWSNSCQTLYNIRSGLVRYNGQYQGKANSVFEYHFRGSPRNSKPTHKLHDFTQGLKRIRHYVMT